MKKKLASSVGGSWRQWLSYALIVVVVGLALWYRLGTLVPGMSAPEITARANANAFSKLIANPIFLPHKLLQYGLVRLHHSGPFWMRSVSALGGLVIVAIFYDIIQGWYSRRVALMTSILFLTSAWFLHFARLGTPDIMFASSIGLLWVGVKLRSTTAPRVRTILASLVILMTCLYVPGLAWLIVPMVVWQRKLLWQEFSKIPHWLAVLTGLGVLVGLAPLVHGFVRHPMLVRDWLLIPAKFSLGMFWSHTWHLPVWLILRGPEIPVYWLGRVPMFDSFSLVMGILGIFVLNYYRLLDRVRAMVAIILLSLALTVLNGWIALAIALPMFFVVIAAGVALFLQQWFTVFPRNPLARVVGIGAVVFVIALAVNYNVHHYFVAWPRNADTKQAFRLL